MQRSGWGGEPYIQTQLHERLRATGAQADLIDILAWTHGQDGRHSWLPWSRTRRVGRDEVAHFWKNLDRHYRLLRLRARYWLDHHPRVDDLLRSSGALSTRNGAISRGVAVGLFVALLPIFGVQTLLIAAVCIAVRGNFPAAFAVSWVNNPLTVAPLYVAFNAIGDRLFSGLLSPLVDLTGWEREVVLEGLYLGSGALCVAIPAAALGYTFAYLAERSLRLRRTARSAPGTGRLRNRRR